MKNCKECYHYELCQALEDNGQVSKIHPNECYFYKHKELVIELPCKVGDTLYGIRKLSKLPPIYSFVAPDLVWIVENFDLFGKEIFLTEKEAENALKRLEVTQ